MKINTMKLKLTALLLVLYTGLYAQNKIVLTAPRLDTSSLSNRINLKANTNLNNVNGVLSSTYGGAGSVSGILKADGSGVVSPVIASDITTLISGTYLPLSGGTLTGGLSGTSAAFSGNVDLGFNNNLRLGTSPYYYKLTRSSAGQLFTYFDDEYDVSNTMVQFRMRTAGTPVNALSIFGTGNIGIKTTFDNGTDALQVAGSGLFSSSVTALGGNFNTSAGGSSLILANTGAQNSNGLEIRGGTAGTTVNWKIEKDNTLSQNLQFTPSTANGGTSFTTPVLSLSSTGAITASSSVTANSFVKSGGTSAQFLKADGSVDGSTYLTSAGAVTSIAGTTNQITVSASTGAVTVSLPSAVTISGAMNASSFFETSDLRKKDIVSVTKQADGIDFVGFKWKKELNLDNRKHLGVIAQQVEKVIPDAVTTDEKGFKSVNYTEVMLYKLEKLTEKVSELEKELKKLKTKKLKN